MRETKDQKINRLARRVETLQTELKATRNADRADLKQYHIQIKTLEQEYKKSTKRQANDKQAFLRQIAELEIALSSAKIQNRELIDELSETKRQLKGYTDSFLHHLDKFWQNRLLSYLCGEVVDINDGPFFNPKTLITAINPRNGQRPTLIQEQEIYNRMKNDTAYKEALERLEQFKKTGNPSDYDVAAFACHEGQMLLKSYVDIFFEE